MELVRATEAAAISAHAWVGRGDKNRADGAAVDAMRAFLSTLEVDGRIVIGEGEKDEAPMLYRGERIGTGRGPELDIAVDPMDGTTLTAAGMPDALSVIAASDGGMMLDASEAFYMFKIVTDSDGRGVVDLDQSVTENIRALAAVKGKPVSALQVAILNRPRHSSLVDEVRAAGARTRLISDGDVAAGINAAMASSPVDMAVGVGGSPEGVATACAIKALDGFMQVRLLRNDSVRTGTGTELDYERIWDPEDLVRGDTHFVATGVTDGDLLSGVRHTRTVVRTESLILRSHTRTIRRVAVRPSVRIMVLSSYVEVEHAIDLLSSGSGIGYLLKQRVTEIDTFLASLGRVLAGESVIDPALVEELVRARRARSPLESLTPREREVLVLMAEGRSNLGISKALHLTEGTVEKHVHHILNKMDLGSDDDTSHRRVLAVLTYLDQAH